MGTGYTRNSGKLFDSVLMHICRFQLKNDLDSCYHKCAGNGSCPSKMRFCDGYNGNGSKNLTPYVPKIGVECICFVNDQHDDIDDDQQREH